MLLFSGRLQAEEVGAMTVKAYAVKDRYQGWGVIVFAGSPDQAKLMARRSHLLGDTELIDMDCKEAPRAESENFGRPEVIHWDTNRGDRVYYTAGWRACDHPHCNQCGYGEFDTIPESQVADRLDIDEDGLCETCYQQALKERQEG